MPVQTKAGTLDPKSFLMAVLNNPDADSKLRIDAARTLLPFMYSKIREASLCYIRTDFVTTAANLHPGFSAMLTAGTIGNGKRLQKNGQDMDNGNKV
uniref:Uncharacterized protein n=1 Tax=Candidatus Nitrotoga fabula TaxID=2182327 RepID=A0A2X0QX71_9PROT|nr:protein of unknown function [Candidatus Nitrotoga fabula]